MTTLSRMIGFVTATDFERAKEFYHGKLGFRPLSEDEYGMTYEANGSLLRINRAKSFEPARGTILGWAVTDMHGTIRALMDTGIVFEQFGLSFMTQDELGVWVAPSGDEVAWFKDPEGNVLSISKHPYA